MDFVCISIGMFAGCIATLILFVGGAMYDRFIVGDDRDSVCPADDRICKYDRSFCGYIKDHRLGISEADRKKEEEKMKYINVWDYASAEYPFQIFLGGRGTGKTFSALKGVITQGRRFIFMRRTAQELDLMLDSDRGEGANPFKPINKELGRDLGLFRIVKNLAGVYNREMIEDKLQPVGVPLGYGVALSTISSIRGIDFSDCDICIYDEFIPEKHVRRIKNEGTALFNAYETMCRNRELAGKPPMLLYMLANSNDLYNDIFIELGIVSDIEKMTRKGKADMYFKDRGLAIHLLSNNEDFVEAKSQTALYKLTAGSTFSDMALNNKFAYEDFSLIGRQSLTGFRPVIGIGRAYMYIKKGESLIYISYARARCPVLNIDNESDRLCFYSDYGRMLKNYYIKGRICFESYELKRIILDLIL